MSQVGVATPTPPEGSPVTHLTLLVLSLVPCVALLLLLNCLFLGYKLLVLSRRSRESRSDTEEALLSVCTRRGVAGAPHHHHHPRGVCASEPILLPPPPVTSSRTSSKASAAGCHWARFLRPDGATGSVSLREPSSILANCCPPGGGAPRAVATGRRDWCRGEPLLPLCSDSEADTTPHLAPPNSPMQVINKVAPIHRSSTLECLAHVNPGIAENLFNKLDFECDCVTDEHPGTASCPDASAAGPGLDSDFGASAGVSLRILSADSDGLSNGVSQALAPAPAPALEWDYYDPCYVQQNSLPAQKPHRPAIHAKQYWV